MWPENWPTVQVFLAMENQWRWTGGLQSVRSGLDFNALPPVYEGLEVPRRQRPAVFRGLKQMETAALDAMAQS